MMENNQDRIIQMDDQLCRYPMLNLGVTGCEQCTGGERVPLMYIPVAGVQEFWKKQTLSAQADLFRYLLSSVNGNHARIAFLIQGDGSGIHLYYGCRKQDVPRLRAAITGLFPGVDIKEPIADRNLMTDYGTGGVMIGQPGGMDMQMTADDAFRLPIDVLCGSMIGSTFTVLVLAEKISMDLILDMYTKVRMEDQQYSRFQYKDLTGSNQRQENRLVQDYLHHLQMAASDLKQGIQEGMWSTSVYYGAELVHDCIRLESLLKGAWMGRRDDVYQPLHCIPLECRGRCLEQDQFGRYITCMKDDGIGADCIYNGCLSGTLIAGQGNGVLDHGVRSGSGRNVFNGYQFRTALTASQLANYVMMPRHEYPGFAVDPYVEFDTAMRSAIAEQDGLRLGNVVRVDQLKMENTMCNPYCLPVDDLTRHLLIVGITGGGKSNTTRAILRELWHKHQVPFLVIESAKREYHELMNVTYQLPDGTRKPIFPELNLFTLGDENPATGIPYRLNPFEVMAGCSIQAHINSLLSTFNAAFDLFAPLPSVLQTMVYEVYEDRGWDIVTNQNRFGATAWPTLTDLYYKIDPVTDRNGYHREVRDNIKAALRVRINSLRMGGKGAMLDVPRSIPLRDLLDQPTVMELETLGDDSTRAFVMGILMMQLHEYRMSGTASKEVRHLLVIEEAHRLLKKVYPGAADKSREEAVNYFCNMISEIRSYGQAIQICDQVPTRLADDALKNTNCKIVHRTVMEDDRMAVGKAMHMNPDQIEFLSSLPRGCAAVYAEGDSRPKLVRFPLVKLTGKKTRAELLRQGRQTVEQRYGTMLRPQRSYSHACRFCENEGCTHRGLCEEWVARLDMKKYWNMLANPQGGQKDPAESPVTYTKMISLCRTAEQEMRRRLSPGEELCLIGMMMQKFPIMDVRRAFVISNYFKYRG